MTGLAGIWPYLVPALLLIASNVFMTLAWYGHLSYKSQPLFVVILVSWGIAFIEYCLAVPANRFGHGLYSAAELKTMQEVITLLVFAVFSVVWLKEAI
ncbi:MAG TPA: DMT family protein, partial [Hyphomicrobiaceae bacterium]|nr:DMT family protein [Hyphomicrobiaceae bacterium]